MKTSLLFSENQIETWLCELQSFNQELLLLNVPFDKNYLFTEEDVAQILGVSLRTMRTYRKKKYLHHLKLEGRIYYLKILLYIDLILLSYQSIDLPNKANA